MIIIIGFWQEGIWENPTKFSETLYLSRHSQWLENETLDDATQIPMDNADNNRSHRS